MNILKRFKRGMVAVLAISVAMSAFFVFYYPMMTARAEGGYEHTYHNVGDLSVAWQAWDKSDSLPDNEAGSFYLTCDVEITETWTPADGTYLCLNGHSITVTESNSEGVVAIYVDISDTFKLCDCSENNAGKITHSSDAVGCGIEVDGTFEMYGGKISGNTSYDNGGGVYVYKDGTFNIFGGEISGNTAKNGSGVYNLGTMTAGGTASIINNTADNVFLPSGKYISISSENPLSGESTKIGVTTQVKPAEAVHDDDGNETPAVEVKIAESTDKNSCSFFISDEDYYVISDGETIKLSTAEPSEDDNPRDEHKHGGIEFTPITDGKLPTEAGNYFLEADVEINDTWTPADGTTLCLNGNTITINDHVPAISVTGSFSLYGDEGGVITHAESKGGVGVEINGGAFAMYGGEISRNKGEGVTFKGGGTLTVGGRARIWDEVVLPDGKTITVDGLEDGAEIHVKTQTEPAEGVDVPITEQNSDNITAYFFSSRADYYIVNGADNAVMLSAMRPIEAPDEHKHGENDDTEWTAISLEDELPEKGGHYYLNSNIIITKPWLPADNTVLCLNGHSFTTGTTGSPNMISVENPNFTLCDCKGTNSVSVNVSEKNTITVGGNLNANITLFKGALIDIDEKFPLTGGKICVTLTNALNNGESAAISTNNAGVYSTRFESAESYTVEVAEGVISLKKPELPPVIEPTRHTHPLCGDNYCREHVDITWTEWNSSTTLPTAAGSYYLTTDVALGARWNVSDDIKLCLNGYTITSSADNAVVYVAKELVLCDCGSRAPAGIITHAGGKSGRGVYIASGGALAMYGGAIRGNSATNGAGVYNDGTFTMRGGELTGNTAAKVGGGLYNNGVAVVEGEIYGNSAAQGAGGVYQNGKLTVANDAYIMQNTVGNSKSNVYLTDGCLITISSGFDGKIGISLETNPKSTGSVIFANGSISAKTLDKITSDSGSFTIKRSGDTLTLSRKASSSDEDDYSPELEIKSKTAAHIPQADRTAIYEMLKTMPDWVVGAYFDITLYDDYDKISESSRNLNVKLTIPSDIRAANRVYKVIRVHDGKATLLDDIDNDPNTITVRSRYFSTYAIVYSVSQSAASSNGNGDNGANGSYDNPAMGVQNDIPTASLVCGFTVLALAVPGKKFEQ